MINIKIEIIGIIANLLIVIGFMFKDIKVIRTLNLIGSILYVAYGFLIHSFSCWSLNILMIFIQVYYLFRLRRNSKL